MGSAMISWSVSLAMLASQPDPFAQVTALVQAVANPTAMKTEPVLVRAGPDVPYPESARAIGAHGTVTVSIVVGIDGKPSEVVVTTSSHSSELDDWALALARAAVFEPAKDAQGDPVSARVTIPVLISGAAMTRQRRGLLDYSCGQFIRDEDWWAATSPGKKSEIYNIAYGAATIAQNGLSSVKAFEASKKAFVASWSRAIGDCKKTPNALFIDVIQPYGPMLRRLWEAGR